MQQRPTRRPYARLARTAPALLLALPLLLAAPADAATSSDVALRWVSAWQGSPTASDPTDDSPTCPAGAGLDDQTVRNVVPVSVGGSRVRVRVSNAFGAAPLQVGAASVALSEPSGAADGTDAPGSPDAAGSSARPDPAATVPGTLRQLTFDGSPTAKVPAGQELVTDPVDLPVAALDRLALSVYLPEATGPATQHSDSRETNSLAPGDATGSPVAGFDQQVSCWLFTTGVDVRTTSRVEGTVVTLGDSITDGARSTADADQRFPDHLARRLAAQAGSVQDGSVQAGSVQDGPVFAVSNAGISGNEVLADRDPVRFGVSVPSRVERDVLSQAGVRVVVLLAGTNDLGAESATAQEVAAGQREVIERAHREGLWVVGATLPPFGGSNEQYGGAYGTPQADAQRQLLNDWIRTSGEFDAVVDVDAALRDPADPTRMLPAYDSGDHLHPSDAGYAAMADAVDLASLLGAGS